MTPSETVAAMAELVEAVRAYLSLRYLADAGSKEYCLLRARLTRALEAMDGEERR